MIVLQEENARLKNELELNVEIERKNYQKLIARKNVLLQDYEVKSKPYQERLENLKRKNNSDLEEKRQERSRLKNQFLTNFLKNSEFPPIDYPKDLSLYWKHNEWDTITKMLNAKKNSINGHESFLKRELGKKNKTLEWFLEKFDTEIKSTSI